MAISPSLIAFTVILVIYITVGVFAAIGTAYVSKALLPPKFEQVYRGHLALLAEVFEDRGETMVGETMVGEARYVVDEHDQSICEFALAIADEWQACGIGRALLQRLERQAARSGIRRMVADALFANKAMLGLAAHSGYALKTNRDDARLVRLEKQLSAAAASLTLHPLAA